MDYERMKKRKGERINSELALPNNHTQQNTRKEMRSFATGALYMLNYHHRSGVH